MITPTVGRDGRVGPVGRALGGFLGAVVGVFTLACAGAALQMLGAQCTSVGCQVVGASPTVTRFQYMEAALTVVGLCGTVELGWTAVAGQFGHRNKSAYFTAACLCACFAGYFALLALV
jgi:hypothetical protein